MYLGIDLGTSEVKVLLLDDRHEIVGTFAVKLSISRPHPGWSEQDPQDWWLATEAAVEGLRNRVGDAWTRIRGIGLSGQMHGAVVLGSSGEVLRPAILWNDTRSSEECEEMMRALPSLADIAGNLAMPGFTAPKIAWLRKHEPEVFERISKVLLPKDYLRYRMTAAFYSDMSDAAGTLWLDVGARTWSRELLGLTGLAFTHMPQLVEGSQKTAPLTAALAGGWGIAGNVVVAGGGGDNASSAVGIGAVKAGDGFISLGTSGVIFVATEAHRPNATSAVHAFCHALPGQWHQMSVTLSAASCLSWWSRSIAACSEEEVIGEAMALDDSHRDAAPLFLPYLSGERTPHNDPHARGVFFGISHDTGRAAMTHSVLEGVAFAMRDGLEALREVGTLVSRLVLVGGGARSPYWAQLLADVLGIEVCTVKGGEAGAALGAARLAWLADGGAIDVVCAPPELDAVHTPSTQRRNQLMTRYVRFRNLYAALRSVFPDHPIDPATQSNERKHPL